MANQAWRFLSLSPTESPFRRLWFVRGILFVYALTCKLKASCSSIKLNHVEHALDLLRRCFTYSYWGLALEGEIPLLPTSIGERKHNLDFEAYRMLATNFILYFFLFFVFFNQKPLNEIWQDSRKQNTVVAVSVSDTFEDLIKTVDNSEPSVDPIRGFLCT